MYPLDFEEFLWAYGIPSAAIDKLRECMESVTPVPEAIHNRKWQCISVSTAMTMQKVVNPAFNRRQTESNVKFT